MKLFNNKILSRQAGILILSFYFYFLAFLAIYLLVKHNINLSDKYVQFLALFLLAWIVSAVLIRKWKSLKKKDFYAALNPFVIAFILMAGIVSKICSVMNIEENARVILLYSLLLGFSLEVALLWIAMPRIKEKHTLVTSYFSFMLELSLLTGIIIFEYFLISNGSINSIIIFFAVYFMWFVSAIFTHKFSLEIRDNYWMFVWRYIKFYIAFFALVYFLLYTLKIPVDVRINILIIVLIYSLCSLFVNTYYFFSKIPKQTDETRLSFLKANEISDEIMLKGKENRTATVYKLSADTAFKESVRNKIQNIFSNYSEKLFKNIDKKIDLDSIDVNKSVILRSRDPFNVQILPSDYLQLFINLHKLNDIRRINEYLIDVNKKLVDGGIFILGFEPIKNRYKRFMLRYPFFICNIFYFMDFIWRRVTPKIPLIQKLYFGITKGRDRALSIAEGLGRLYYCGFNVFDIHEDNNLIYIIAIKKRLHSVDPNPSYGPFFKMKRVGQWGKPINVYKLRTMHPYSEYLQDYMVNNFGYADIGKPSNDFRVTTWGRILRKYWLDELPQLINVFRGEMKLVGIRPISQRFLNEFPEDVKQLRYKYKPGCIPAYVTLLKQSKNGFIEAETIYLKEKERHPFTTDAKFFFVAIYNILTNRIRSA